MRNIFLFLAPVAAEMVLPFFILEFLGSVN